MSKNAFMKSLLYYFISFFIIFNLEAGHNKAKSDIRKTLTLSPCITATKKITLEAYPDAFNPSICKNDTGYVMIFRYCPDRRYDAFSFIGIVQLNDDFDPISEPQLLETRFWSTLVSPHAEDPRIFSIAGKLYITYSDSPHVFLPGSHHRRDIYVAELLQDDGRYSLATPIQLQHLTMYDHVRVQKNWVPFEWNNQLYMIYSAQPHEILYVNLETGVCIPIYKTLTATPWSYGVIRGGTPALFVDGEYLSFFHSSQEISSPASDGKKLLHYFMGAYTFSAAPPFAVTKMSSTPLIGENFYVNSEYHKRVVFPAGFIVSKHDIYVVLGRDDKEIWMATINKELLQKNLAYSP